MLSAYERFQRMVATSTDYERQKLTRLDLARFGLVGVRRLLAAVGDPHLAYPVAHIAGSKGKGTTATVLASILRHAGYRTGCFTSPHLIHLGERLAVDGHSASEADLGEAFAELELGLDCLTTPPTFFELISAMAFVHFRRLDVEIAVIEVGLGGRLDATNVVQPVVTAVTSIEYEHTAVLGCELGQIATEKAGIIKAGVPVICGSLVPEAARSIAVRAASVGAPVWKAPDDLEATVLELSRAGVSVRLRTPTTSSRLLRSPLVGVHCAENLAIAVAMAEVIEASTPLSVPEAAIEAGVGRVELRGRFQVVGTSPVVVVDVAHTVRSVAALWASVARVFPNAPVVCLVAALADKELSGIAAVIAEGAEYVVATTVDSPRTRAADETLAVCVGQGAVGGEAVPCSRRALERAREVALTLGSDAVVVVCGSTYLAGSVLERSVVESTEQPKLPSL